MKNLLSIFKKNKIQYNDYIEQRENYIFSNRYSILGREIKYLKDSYTRQGVVVAESIKANNNGKFSRIYSILDEVTENIVKVPEEYLVLNKLDLNHSDIKSSDIIKDIKSFCSSGCIMECNKHCPLFNYKNYDI